MECVVYEELICGSYCGSFCLLGNFSCGSESCEVCGELSYAGVVNLDVLGLGCAEGGVALIVSSIRTEIVLLLACCGCPAVGLFNVVINSVGVLGYESCLTVCGDIDIGLGAVVIEVESVSDNGIIIFALGNFLDINVYCLCIVIGGLKILIVDSAVEVEGLAVECVVYEELVCGLGCGVGSLLRKEGIGGSRDKLDVVSNGLVSLTAGSNEGYGYGSGLFGKSNDKLAVLDLNVLTGSGPCEGNGVVLSACCGKSDRCCLGNSLGNGDTVDLEVDLLSVGSFDLSVVGLNVNAYGDEIECAVVKLNDTGNVCLVALVGGVVSLEGIDICLGDTVVGGRNSYVRLERAELEVVVAVVFLNTADLNALNGYEHRLSGNESSVGKSSSVLIDLGEINGLNGLDSSVIDLDVSGYYLVKSIVCILDTGYGYGHTNLNSKVSIGILGINETVYIITALTLEVLDVYAVAGRTVGLGEDTGYNTANNYGSIVCCCSVLSEGEYLECGNGSLEGSGLNVTVSISDSSGKSVTDRLVCLGNNYGYEVGILCCYDSNSLIVGFPGYRELNALNGNYGNEVVA